MDKLIVSLGAAILGLFLYEKASQKPEQKTLAKSVPVLDNPPTPEIVEPLQHEPDITESLDDIANDGGIDETVQAGD